MKNIFVFGIVAILSLQFGFSQITGKVTYEDQKPPARAIKMGADPDCAAKHTSPVYNERMVFGEDGKSFANVLVYIQNPPQMNYMPPAEPVIIDQVGCMYVPHVVGVQTGQTIQFRNSDGILHNVHGLPRENREFNIGMAPSLKEKEIVLNESEFFLLVKDDVHPWKKGYISVMDHPHFSVSDKDGTFEIADVPDGNYTVIARHEMLGEQKGEVTVGSGKAEINFVFKAPRR